MNRLPQLAPTVATYLASVVEAYSEPGSAVVSVVLFGSAAVGGYSAAVSDVDLLIVLSDKATSRDRDLVRERITMLEERSGAAKPRPYHPGRLDALVDRITANTRTFFVCRRADLLSGNPARLLDISPAQARFVDRVAIPSIVLSGITLWGEDLLGSVPLPPIRRLDVAKAFFGLFNQALFSAAAYALLPGATRHAMDALKRSVHSCYFCYHSCRAPLHDEVAFFQQRQGPSRALTQLLALRNDYQASLGFVFACLPTLIRLHVRTALDLEFPRETQARSPEL